jgi:uncharacterized protein YcgI (DUF1989 family)
MRLRLTDFQLAALTRLLAADPDAGSISDLLAAAFVSRLDDSPEPPPSRGGERSTGDEPPAGAIRLDTVLPAATGRAVMLQAGDSLRIEQLAGGQCVDLTAFERGPERRVFSAARTRAEHGIHPTVGTPLLSTPPEIPLLRIVSDSAPGHDLAFPACTGFEYERLTGIRGHLNCHAIHAATQRRGGVDAPVPDPLNLWLPSAVTASGALRSWPASCGPGDYVDLRACVDVIVVLSACPDDVYGSSQYEPKPVRLIVAAPENRRRPGPGPLPRITRRMRTPLAAIARNTVDVKLPARARGDADAALARALLCRLIEQSGPATATSRQTTN